MIELDVGGFRDIGEMRRFDPSVVIVCGYAGADSAAVQHHIDELADAGVPAPPHVPMYWAFPPSILTQGDGIEVTSEGSSGEVELVMVCDGDERFVTVGSDHTDREAEQLDIFLSKAVCPKPIGRRAWPFDGVAGRWAEVAMTSTVTEAGARSVYQSATADANVDPTTLASQVPWAGAAPTCWVMFCGTVPVVGGIRPADRFEAEVSGPAGSDLVPLSLDYEVLPVRVLR